MLLYYPATVQDFSAMQIFALGDYFSIVSVVLNNSNFFFGHEVYVRVF